MSQKKKEKSCLVKTKKKKQNNYHTHSLGKKKKKATSKKEKKRKNIGNKKRKRSNIHEKKKKKKRKRNWTWAFLSIKQPYFLPPVFSPFWKENFLVGLGRKHLGFTIYFPSSSPNQTHSKKFSFPFSLQGFPSILFHLQTNTPLR